MVNLCCGIARLLRSTVDSLLSLHIDSTRETKMQRHGTLDRSDSSLASAQTGGAPPTKKRKRPCQSQRSKTLGVIRRQTSKENMCASDLESPENKRRKHEDSPKSNMKGTSNIRGSSGSAISVQQSRANASTGESSGATSCEQGAEHEQKANIVAQTKSCPESQKPLSTETILDDAEQMCVSPSSEGSSRNTSGRTHASGRVDTATESDESHEKETRVLWLRLLSGFMHSFDDLSSDAQLCLVARLLQIGANEEAEKFWKLYGAKTKNARENSLSPKRPSDPPQMTTFFSGLTQNTCDEVFAGESPIQAIKCQPPSQEDQGSSEMECQSDIDDSADNSSPSSEAAIFGSERSSPQATDSDSVYCSGSFDSISGPRSSSEDQHSD